ncbi:Uncharacterised protein [Bordetella pertussis]|nr:Uncharacterised protein [Bordetella pertussis]
MGDKFVSGSSISRVGLNTNATDSIAPGIDRCP